MQKKIVFLRLNPNATGGAEHYLLRLKEALSQAKTASSIRRYSGKKWLSSWIKALIFNAQARRAKANDELYFSLERIDSADIYRAGDGVHKIYRQSKKLWWLNPLNFVYPYLEKRCFNNAKIIIANSNFIARQITEAYGISREKISVIYNGVKIPSAVDKMGSKKALCDELGLDSELPILLFVGSGFKRKGVSELLFISKALNELKFKHNLIIIGKDKRLKSYEKMANKLEVKAKFMGERKDVARFYEASEAFIFPTLYEPFSNVILEALSYGCISLSTTQNGASEILPKEWVLSADSLNDARLIIKALSENKAQEAQEIAAKYTIEKNALQTLSLINDVLKANMLK